jgi:hypothetical protein
MGFEFPLTLAKEVSGTVRCPSRHIPAELAVGSGKAGIGGPRNDGKYCTQAHLKFSFMNRVLTVLKSNKMTFAKSTHPPT